MPPPAPKADASSTPTAESSASSAPAPVADASITPTAAAFALRDIPNPKPPGSGPIKVEGYPTKLDSGMSDPAQAFGYLDDGTTFAYCEPNICCAQGAALCKFFEEDGKVREWRTDVMMDDKPAPGVEKRSLREIQEFPKKEGLAILKPAIEMRKSPPSVTGTIPYGDEITIVFREVPVSEDAGHNIKSPGSIRVGGRLPGEKAVYPAGVPLPDFCQKYPQACMHAELNGVSVSPSGDELVFLQFTHNPSHGSSFSHLRVKVAALAASVFNDTGMAHHEKKEWARAAELFTRAVYADPTKERFAYNLACALARQSDTRARHALEHAISIGGGPVKKRAANDADFASVKAAPWFASATQ